MAFRQTAWGLPPGLTGATETYEAAFRWGGDVSGLITNALINSAAIDSGNTPTYELRVGLVMGQKTDGSWLNYSPTAVDGSGVAAGVLITSIDMQNILTGTNVTRFYGMLVGGPVQSAKLLGLDLMARQQMDKFIFDDVPGGYQGGHWFPWKTFISKTANYSVLATDNYTLFDNTGAAGAVTFTLPAIANGYLFGFRVQTGQNVLVTSNEGSNVVAFNNASASTVAFQTGGQLIGGMFYIYSNPGATKWIVENASAGTNTITVS